jgi:DNA-binding MarR family transcriptional regulator
MPVCTTETGDMLTNLPDGSAPAPAADHRIGRLSLAIRRAEHAVSGSLGSSLREVDLTVTQYGTLLVLAESPGLSGAQLARVCQVTPQSMASVLARLVERGLIARSPSAVHQKVLVARLSRTGWSVLRKADRLLQPTQRQLAASIGARDQADLVRYLERIVDLLGSGNGNNSGNGNHE